MIRWISAFIDRPVARLDEAVAFWTAVTGTKPAPQEDPGFVRLHSATSDDWLEIQGVRDGPGGAHLDLAVTDVAAFAATARDAGATTVADHGSWQVLRSPAGQAFCVAAGPGGRVLPRALTAPDGTRTLLDQVCLDVGPAGYDTEVAFWAGLTGWRLERLPPCFHRLTPQPRLAVRILLQRTDHEQPPSAHLDLACSDVRAARARHEQLGAAFVGEWPEWTVMRDPAGGRYCLTGRVPPGEKA
ncbi:VOC family protein [Actinoplanes nipponensis]|nr:VOC family protein [Actinoplanes nipponensis]